ncbi:hypothetical protein C8R44DRAFT_886612 [Mycena epipterygia]|nr:hypothetical protein C8R44DRAFT_886612 [Mycena epipterygia]
MTVTISLEPTTLQSAPTDGRPQQIVVPEQQGSSTSTLDFHSLPRTLRPPKPKQRNSAERRATHNAVERQRRENLNARFVDLAALLPNLIHIRRPSKSSIVNSSIAHVRASRRHRLLSAQHLRVLNDECESLRREVNEWRDRAGVSVLLGSPNRGEGFSLILSGAELEFEEDDLQCGDGEEDEEGEGYAQEDFHSNNRRFEQQQFQFTAHNPEQFQSPFAHDVPSSPPPPHSAHGHGHGYGHDGAQAQWYDERALAAHPHSAHEPLMAHAYVAHPHASSPPHPHGHRPHASPPPHALHPSPPQHAAHEQAPPAYHLDQELDLDRAYEPHGQQQQQPHAQMLPYAHEKWLLVQAHGQSQSSW